MENIHFFLFFFFALSQLPMVPVYRCGPLHMQDIHIFVLLFFFLLSIGASIPVWTLTYRGHSLLLSLLLLATRGAGVGVQTLCDGELPFEGQ